MFALRQVMFALRQVADKTFIKSQPPEELFLGRFVFDL